MTTELLEPANVSELLESLPDMPDDEPNTTTNRQRIPSSGNGRRQDGHPTRPTRSNKTMNIMEAIDRKRAERQELEAERERIIEASTARKLERNQQAMQECIVANGKLEEFCRAAMRASKPIQRESDLSATLKISRDRERQIIVETGPIPDGYICADAVAHAERGLEELWARVAKAFEPIEKNPRLTAGPRLIAEQSELTRAENQWAKTKKTALAGQEIFELRQSREPLERELHELVTERETQVLQQTKCPEELLVG